MWLPVHGTFCDFVNHTSTFGEKLQQHSQQYWPFNNNNKNSPETVVVLAKASMYSSRPVKVQYNL